MTDLLSLLCVAATHEGTEMDDPRVSKRKKLSNMFPGGDTFLSPFAPSGSLMVDSSPKNRSSVHSLYSSTSSSRSPLGSASNSPIDERESGSFTPTGSIDTSSVTSGLDEADETESEDETNDPSIHTKKRKRTTKHQSRRAKPLTVDTLYHIFETLGVFKEAGGTYKLALPALKSAECSAKYFAVTEWQCFRKRIMNHGFEIVDEQQALWVRIRPNLQTLDGLLVFDHAELRIKYSTPCKIKSARERGELLELPGREHEEFDNPTNNHHNHILPNEMNVEENKVDVSGEKRESSAEFSPDTPEFVLESSFKNCLPQLIRELCANGKSSFFSPGFEVQLSIKPAVCRTTVQPRVFSLNAVKTESQ